MEAILLPVVQKFVADQRGFYQPHVSDATLVALLMWRLSGPFRHLNPGKSLAQALLEGDTNAAYEASCCIFERVLEYGARAGGNGHHRAQKFAAAMTEGLEFAPYPPIRSVEEYNESYTVWEGSMQVITASDNTDERTRASAICAREEKRWAECNRFFDFDSEGNIIGLKSDEEAPATPEVAETPTPVRGLYDAGDQLGDMARPREPHFFLRGRDYFAPGALQFYTQELSARGAAKESAEAAEVLSCMLLWQAENPCKVKMPDGMMQALADGDESTTQQHA